MGLLRRFFSAGFSITGDGNAEKMECDALRLIDEGNVLEEEGRADEAMKCYEAAVRMAPKLARGQLNRGNILLVMGQLEAALDAYEEALFLDPQYAAAHFNKGNAYVHLGLNEDALAAYRKAIALKEDFADAEVAQGSVLEEMERFDDAIASYRRALLIKPDYAEVYCNLGNTLKGLGRLDEAVEHYRRALEIKPAYVQVYSSLGLVLQDLGRWDEAAAYYRKALLIKPDFVEVLGNLGNIMLLSRRFDDAFANYGRVLELQPDDAIAYNNLGNALNYLGRLDEALASYRRALALKPDFTGAQSNLLFLLNFLADQPALQLLAEARRYGELVAQVVRPPELWRNSPEAARCLRVGLVSGDLCAHPVGYFIEGVLAELATETTGRLQLLAYASHFRDDEVTERIKAYCHGWHSVRRLSDEVLAQRIRDDGIDILIDLSGHTGCNRLPMFAWRPAPVQVSWLGYFATTGVAAIDYLIADPWTLPESEEASFTERIWRLPETRLCFTPPDVKVQVAPLPALSSGSLTFACFNNLAKINDAVVLVWARILSAVPASRLFLMAPQLKESAARRSVIERFTAHGIDAERLILEEAIPRAEYLAAYQRVDIALDPFPYTGGTTTVEALWMGVPVLTLAGTSFLSRQGVGLLMNAGLPEWVAADADDYVARAVAYASDLSRLALLRTGLRQQVLASPIFDARRFARHFEAALHGMWQKWCDEKNHTSRDSPDIAGGGPGRDLEMQ